jgi:hypothetical protein
MQSTKCTVFQLQSGKQIVINWVHYAGWLWSVQYSGEERPPCSKQTSNLQPSPWLYTNISASIFILTERVVLCSGGIQTEVEGSRTDEWGELSGHGAVEREKVAQKHPFGLSLCVLEHEWFKWDVQHSLCFCSAAVYRLLQVLPPSSVVTAECHFQWCEYGKGPYFSTDVLAPNCIYLVVI